MVSRIEATCSEWAYDGRVSVVLDAWILPTVLGYAGVFSDGFELSTTERWSAVVP